MIYYVLFFHDTLLCKYKIAKWSMKKSSHCFFWYMIYIKNGFWLQMKCIAKMENDFACGRLIACFPCQYFCNPIFFHILKSELSELSYTCFIWEIFGKPGPSPLISFKLSSFTISTSRPLKLLSIYNVVNELYILVTWHRRY